MSEAQEWWMVVECYDHQWSWEKLPVARDTPKQLTLTDRVKVSGYSKVVSKSHDRLFQTELDCVSYAVEQTERSISETERLLGKLKESLNALNAQPDGT